MPQIDARSFAGEFSIVASRKPMLNKRHTIAASQREPVTQSASLLMKVKLVRKFANAINGIDLSHARVGDVLELSAYHAALLIGEGWAEHAVAPAQGGDVQSAAKTNPAQTD